MTHVHNTLDKADRAQYINISLLPIASKFVERVLFKRCLLIEPVIHKTQIGFQKKQNIRFSKASLFRGR